MLYQGLRPSEVCQLGVCDIQIKDNVPCFVITENGEDQHLKTASSIRTLSVHSALINNGFLSFVAKQKAARCVQIFRYKAEGKWVDWATRYCKQFGRLQTAIGMPAKARPTAYSFRHTFIDELKQQGCEESLVAQIVGHTHQNLTFGRYGKKYPIKTLVDVIELIGYPTINIFNTQEPSVLIDEINRFKFDLE